MKDNWKTFRSGIMAGICIALGGVVNLSVGGVGGAVLFAFGLLTVVNFGYRLYTGTAGFIDIKKGKDWSNMGIIILGNIAGCALVAAMVHYALPDLVEKAGGILEKRIAKGALQCGVLGIACGFVMTAAVKFARAGRFLPLLFGVPLFILCGFTHSIADAFYYLAAPLEALAVDPGAVALVYLSILVGNFAGCNLSRFVMPENY